MKETKEEAHQLMKKMRKVAESPYELIEPKFKTKTNYNSKKRGNNSK